MPSEQFDMVCLGGGVAAGYWAEEVVSLLKAAATQPGFVKPKMCIISAYPDGLAPYERSELSKDCLRPSNLHLRDWQAWGNKTFPYTSSGNGREKRNARWYRERGVTMLSGCECYEVDVDESTLKLLQYSERARTRAKAKEVKVKYETLLIATGSTPRRLHGDRESACFCVRHVDMRGPRIERQESYGLGSAHYLRDLGDCIKLVKALSTPPPWTESGDAGAGAAGDANTVALVGGGLLCIEVAAAIAKHYPGVHPILLMSGSQLMPGFFNQEMSDFYEQALVRAGVTIEKHVTAERLWGLEEQGEFETLGGSRVNFGPAPRGFTECRGVVLHRKGGHVIHVPAKVVLVGIGTVPNSELFRGQLKISEDGGIYVDPHCRALSPAKAGGMTGDRKISPVFAAGDVATYPLALENSRRVRHEHVQNARDMAVVAARNMVGGLLHEGGKENGGSDVIKGYDIDGGGRLPVYHPVPGFSSRILDLSWRFYGIAEGEVVVLGAAEFPTTRTFGAFWVRGERVVGAFLEGGTVEQQVAVAQVTRLRPKVFSPRLLKDTQLGDFLEDPGSIEASDESDFSQLLMCCRCV